MCKGFILQHVHSAAAGVQKEYTIVDWMCRDVGRVRRVFRAA